jgi:hypothetical protein
LTAYNSNNNFVWNEFSRIHEILGHLSNLRFGRDGSSQHVTSTQMNDAKLFLDKGTLRSLSSRGGTTLPIIFNDFVWIMLVPQLNGNNEKQGGENGMSEIVGMLSENMSFSRNDKGEIRNRSNQTTMHKSSVPNQELETCSCG